MFDRLDASAKNTLNQRRADRYRVASELVKKETLEHQELMKLLAKPAPMEAGGPDYFSSERTIRPVGLAEWGNLRA